MLAGHPQQRPDVVFLVDSPFHTEKLSEFFYEFTPGNWLTADAHGARNMISLLQLSSFLHLSLTEMRFISCAARDPMSEVAPMAAT